MVGALQITAPHYEDVCSASLSGNCWDQLQLIYMGRYPIVGEPLLPTQGWSAGAMSSEIQLANSRQGLIHPRLSPSVSLCEGD